MIVLMCATVSRGQDQDDKLIRTARIEDAATLGVGRPVPDLELTPLKGEKQMLSALLKDRKGLVIVMTSSGCPMCAKYSPRLAAMERELGPKGIGFVYVNSIDAESITDMAQQVKKYRIEGPYVADRGQRIAAVLGARTTTEAFLIDAARTLVYRGAVDDQYGVGVTLDAAKHTFLQDAVDVLLTSGAGARPRVRATWSPGCLLELDAAPAPAESVPTYNGRIAWILAENCVTCHRAGAAANVAPFALDTYESVNGRAKMIEAVVGDGLMPPWHGATHPEGEPSPWVTDRSIPQRDREALLTWLKSDRPRGELAPGESAPPQPRLSNTWSIGEPDLLVLTSGMRLKAQGGLQYARVMVALATTEDRWLTTAEFRPVDAGSVHHALIWVLAPGGVLPQQGEVPSGLELLASYSPGDNVLRYPAGTARKIRAGSIFIVDLYAVPMGKEVISALRIAMKFAPPGGGETKWGVRSMSASAAKLDMATDSPRSTNTVELALPTDSQLLALHPYMRSRGREISIDAVLPDGTTRRLLAAPRYDFRWQVRYEFVEPVSLPAGTKLVARGVHENGAGGLAVGTGVDQETVMFGVELVEGVGAK